MSDDSGDLEQVIHRVLVLTSEKKIREKKRATS